MKCYRMHDERAAATEARIIATVGEFAYYRQADRRREKLAVFRAPTERSQPHNGEG